MKKLTTTRYQQPLDERELLSEYQIVKNYLKIKNPVLSFVIAAPDGMKI